MGESVSKSKKPIERTPIEPPADTPEFMWGAWAGCLRWALTNPEIRAQFEKDTGHLPFPMATTPIDRMIDEACGRDYEYLKSFAEWHDKNIWGPMDGSGG